MQKASTTYSTLTGLILHLHMFILNDPPNY